MATTRLGEKAMAKKEEIQKPKLNELIINETIRESNGSTRYALDFSNCPTMAEQHSAHLTDINYLIQKYKPDELAAYMAARAVHRQEILGHDFTQEPDLQEAKNIVLKSKQEFNNLPDEVRKHFANHLEFLKFIDNPANEKKMLELGILTKKQIDAVKLEEPTANTATPMTTQEEAKEAKKK